MIIEFLKRSFDRLPIDKEKSKVFNLPNTITLLRMSIIPVLFCLLTAPEQTWSLVIAVLFMIAALTDMLDGYIARKYQIVTTMGKYLDPIADKALMVSCFITLSVKHVIPGWLSVIVVSRDCIILIGIAVLAIMSISFQIRPTMISKMTMFFQLLTIFTVLILHTLSLASETAMILMGLYIVTSLLTIVSGLNYIFKGIGFINAAT